MRILLAVLFFLASGSAYAADAASLFEAGEGDVALKWLRAIYRGTGIEEGSSDYAAFSSIAAALRNAMGYYSIGIFTLAGFILAYVLVSAVAETAQTGRVMGRKGYRTFVPLRLALAIGLLAPIGGGLNAGQYITVKAAESGSALASNIWKGATEAVKDRLSGFALPPSGAHERLAAVAVEMELCRSIYQELFAANRDDGTVGMAGDMFGAKKNPAERLAPETWRYSNSLHSSIPLCGEYRFFLEQNGTSNPNAAISNLAPFSRDLAEFLSSRARGAVDGMGKSFAALTSPGAEISGNFLLLNKELKNALFEAFAKTKIHKGDSTEKYAGRGWVSAGNFVPAVAVRQSGFGEIFQKSIPSVQAPLFGHKALSGVKLTKLFDDDSYLRTLPQPATAKLYRLYEQMNISMKAARSWLYGGQTENAAAIPPDQFDLEDRLGSTADFETGYFLFMRAADAAFASFGLREKPVAAADNPIAAMAEIGGRYKSFGAWMLGLSGAGMSGGALPVAISIAFLGFVFSVCGFALIFILPLIPLFRFLMGVLVWMLSVFEALAALPLIFLSFINSSGEGLFGANSARPFLMLLSAILRPALTLLGFVAGLLFLSFSLSLVNAAYFDMVGETEYAVVRGVAASLLYFVLAYAAVNFSFKGVNALPEAVFNWIRIAAEGAGDSWNETHSSVASSRQISSGDSVHTRYAQSSFGHEPVSSRGTSKKAQSSADKVQEQRGEMKSALFPDYRDKPEAPVNIPPAKVGAAVQSAGHGTAAAAAVSTGGHVSASAHASATATVRQAAPLEKPAYPDILEAVANLAQKVDGKTITKDDEEKESKEQSSEPDEDDNTNPQIK